MTAPGPAEMLRGAGLRSTAPRRAVLSRLHGAPHATAADLADALNAPAFDPGTAPGAAAPSHQGLYNVLDDLTTAGLVRCFRPGGSAARYELRVGDNHHHLVCRDCGHVADVDCTVGSAPCIDPGTVRGFAAVDEAELIWWGTCETCARRRDGESETVHPTLAAPSGRNR